MREKLSIFLGPITLQGLATVLVKRLRPYNSRESFASLTEFKTWRTCEICSLRECENKTMPSGCTFVYCSYTCFRVASIVYCKRFGAFLKRDFHFEILCCSWCEVPAVLPRSSSLSPTSEQSILVSKVNINDASAKKFIHSFVWDVGYYFCSKSVFNLPFLTHNHDEKIAFGANTIGTAHSYRSFAITCSGRTFPIYMHLISSFCALPVEVISIFHDLNLNEYCSESFRYFSYSPSRWNNSFRIRFSIPP